MVVEKPSGCTSEGSMSGALSRILLTIPKAAPAPMTKRARMATRVYLKRITENFLRTFGSFDDKLRCLRSILFLLRFISTSFVFLLL